MTMSRCLIFATVIGLLLRWTPSAWAIARHWDDGSANDLWISAANWNPDGVPENVDTVVIGNLPAAVDDTVLFAAFGGPLTDTITGLWVTLGADLDTREGRLVIIEDTFVGGTSVVVTPETKSELIVSPYAGGDAIDTNTLTVLDNGQLTMTGGSISVDGTAASEGVLEIQEGGSVYGYGVINLDDDNAPAFTNMLLNDGTITVGDPEAFVIGEPPGRTLQINAPNAPNMGLMDIDGDSNDGQVVILRNSTLELNVPQIDQSSPGDIRMYGNSTLDLGVSFGVGYANALDDTGALYVNSGATDGVITLPAAPSVITGSSFILAQRGNILLTQSDAELRIESEFTAFNGTIFNNGVIHFAGDARIEPQVTFFGNGQLVNDPGNTLRLSDGVNADTGLVNEGVLAIGLFAGDVRVDSFEQTANGVLEIQIGNILPGDFDVLTVDGNATLGGTLEVSLINDFEPVLGNSFTILETVFGNVSGQFDVENVPIFNDMTFDVIYNPQTVVLAVVEAGLPGDYNNDGIVDAADYVMWRDSLGASAGTLPNDTDGGAIGQAQYDTWSANFGNAAAAGAESGATSSAQASVPEPSTGALVLLTMTGIGVISLRQRIVLRSAVP